MASPHKFKLVVLTTATLLTGYVFGILLTFGSIFNRMLEKYQESRSSVPSVQAILVGVGMSSGVFCCIVIAQLGLWKASLIGAALSSFGFIFSFFATSVVQLYFLIGVVTGLGTSIIYLSCTTALGIAYDGPKRVVAITIQNTSFSVSGIALPYFFNLLVDRYGVNGTFLIMGGICLNCFPASIVFAVLERDHNKSDLRHTRTGKKESHNTEGTLVESIKQRFVFLKQTIWAIMSPPYVLNCLGAGVTIGSVIAFQSLMIDVLSWKGLSESEALFGFPVGFATGFVARILAGIARTCNAGQSLLIPTIYTSAGCCGFLMILLFTSVPVILSGCGLTGIASSGVVSASFIVAVQMVDKEHISVGVGLVVSAVGVSTAALGPSFGAMRDSSQSYSDVLLLASGIQFLGVCLFIAAMVSWRLSNKDAVLKENSHVNTSVDNRKSEDTYL